ncbi:MAG TPA: 2-amino-4-hydroxy-6-hydroxymethyldihydropteridine diphosphokinase [Cyclobacteriaceae bacterium]|jgi:2-amino-4-hydroxy-6-hydroxymethyldihydropteridine diphosphokinase|nr:2-amino-4-hydroxy-6-hydroxymethyldihydropteridine diphosphokinase [Cyclobacteriaceae bacterium]
MLSQNIFLLTGSNLGDRLQNLNTCSALIEAQVGPVSRRSSIYETAPWGKTDQGNFLNQALQIESALLPTELLAACLAIEEKIGRVRYEPWGARTIDLDIIYYDQKSIDSNELKIPHPRIRERRFVLVPLSELAPEFIHPVLKKTNFKLLQECTDSLEVKIFDTTGSRKS